MTVSERVLRRAGEHLEPGEQVLGAVLGAYETTRLGMNAVRNGVLLATDRRVVMFGKRRGGFELESFPYEHISSFEQGRTLMGSTIRMFASGNTVEVKYVNDRRAMAELVSVVKSRMGGTGASVPPAPGQPDLLEAIRKLGELRDAGLLTEDEFQAKKAQLLARL